MIKVEHLTKSYGKKLVIDDLNIEFGNGIYGLLGPNGAGKTTLMRIIATILNSDSGEIYVNGMSIKDKRNIRKKIGYLPQKFMLYKGLTVEEALRHIAIMKELNFKEINTIVTEVIQSVNLQEKANEKIGSLSGGMIRRLGIAQALIGNLDVLLVDEPTAGLDPEERIRFRTLLSEICVSQTVIISTHIVEDVQFLCDKIAILDRGKLVLNDSYEEIINKVMNKIWEIELPVGKTLGPEFKVVSKRRKGESYICRFISDKYIENAKCVDANLEDAYMYVIGEFNEKNG